MSDWINVAVDAMGGDNAPEEVVKGAVNAVLESKRIRVDRKSTRLNSSHMA